MTLENALDRGKFTFLAAEKIIGLIILKTNASVETIKTCFLNIKQKLDIFSRILKRKY